MSSPASTPLDRNAPAWRDAASLTYAALALLAAATFAIGGRRQWFFGDEWAFLVIRDGGSIDGLFTPHQEHWTAIPVAIYRVMWNIVGAGSYKPYQAISIGVHLVVVTLLLALMRQRLGIKPWVATIAAAVLLFFGGGSENVVWAFQITFTGALAFGLANLLISDHPNPSLSRRVAGLLCGLAALMCSGVGLVMVGVVGLALLIGRGWRAAAGNAAPLLAIYLAWRSAFASNEGTIGSDVGRIARFAATGLDNAASLLGQSWVVVVGQLVVTVTGVVLVAIASRADSAGRRRRLGIVGAMALGACAFYAFVGIARTDVGVDRAERFGLDLATRSRYAYIAVALLMPAIALGFDAVIRRWPRMTIPVLVLLVAGIPANVSAITIRSMVRAPNAVVLAVANSEALTDAPPRLKPFPEVPGYRVIRVGWLRDAVKAGRIPTDVNIGPGAEAEALALLTIMTGGPWLGSAACSPLPADGVEVQLSRTDPVGFVGAVIVEVVGREGARSRPRFYGSFEPRELVTVGHTVLVSVAPKPGPLPGQLCR